MVAVDKAPHPALGRIPMDDIVAVEVETDSERGVFLTWGRIQDPVDAGPLEMLVMRQATNFSLKGKPMRARVISLQRAHKEPYFFEAFFTLCQEKVPFGRGYENWRKKIARQMERGEHLFFISGPSEPNRPS